MEDFAEQLNTLLKNPEAMAQAQALLTKLTGDNAAKKAPEESASTTALSNLGNLNALAALLGSAPKKQESSLSAPNQELLQTMAQVMPLLSSFQQEDAATRLLTSLRPLLSGPRQKKLDEAARLLKVLRLLPLLRSKGIL